jgi:pimeloyl-ACP methyl ester carboxylesterase
MDQPALVGYRLIGYHRRGYAGSSRTAGPVTIADQAADLARLLDILGVERAYVAGHSYGGLIATQLTLTRPDLVGPSCLWSQRYGSYPEDRPVGTWAGGWRGFPEVPGGCRPGAADGF